MQVGFVGVGTMGGAIATNVVAAGFDVVAYDRSREALERLSTTGVRAVASSADAGRASQIVHVIVFTDEQASAAVLGSDDDRGLLSTMSPGSVIVIHSTVRPQTCVDLALAAAAAEVDLIDAAMTGTAEAARAGTLTLLAGGSAEVLDRCRVELDAFSQRIVHVGPVGAGALAKIINNVLVLANAEALRECIALAGAAGTPPAMILDVINSSTSRSWVSEQWEGVRATVDDVADPQNYAAMSVKDCTLALEAARQCAVALPVGELVARRLSEIVRPEPG